MNKIIYNVTVNVDDAIHDDWLKWMREKHIPDVMSTGYFLENKLCKILIEEQQGTSYAIQYTCASMNDLDEYKRDHAPRLQKQVTDRYKDKFVAFRTLLEIISVA
jgi:Domain of unknown function (DUF4286)